MQKIVRSVEGGKSAISFNPLHLGVVNLSSDFGVLNRCPNQTGYQRIPPINAKNHSPKEAVSQPASTGYLYISIIPLI